MDRYKIRQAWDDIGNDGRVMAAVMLIVAYGVWYAQAYIMPLLGPLGLVAVCAATAFYCILGVRSLYVGIAIGACLGMLAAAAVKYGVIGWA